VKSFAIKNESKFDSILINATTKKDLESDIKEYVDNKMKLGDEKNDQIKTLYAHLNKTKQNVLFILNNTNDINDIKKFINEIILDQANFLITTQNKEMNIESICDLASMNANMNIEKIEILNSKELNDLIEEFTSQWLKNCETQESKREFFKTLETKNKIANILNNLLILNEKICLQTITNSINFENKQNFLMMGPTGSGKSTLVNLLTGHSLKCLKTNTLGSLK
jgi:flagellar biosynthesis GTPase FlhF